MPNIELSNTTVLHRDSYWQIAVKKTHDHAPAVMTMLVTATLVYKIWGGFLAMCAVGAVAITYIVLHRQIEWLMNSNDWLPALTRRLMSPTLAFFGGWIGMCVAWVIDGASTIGEQWEFKRQRTLLEGANSALQQENQHLAEINHAFEDQVRNGQALIDRILQICPELQSRFAGINQNTEQVQQNQARINTAMEQFLQYYETVVKDPNIMARVAAVNRLEAQMAQTLALMGQYNAQLSERLDKESRIALKHGDMESIIGRQIEQLHLLIREIPGQK